MKEKIIRMHVDERQVEFWMKSLKDLGLQPGERSDYIRHAVDRAIAQDFRSQDPKWQKFIKATQKLAVKHLGYGLSDNFDDRKQIYRAVLGVVWKRREP